VEKTLISQTDSPAPFNVAGVNDSHAKLRADFPNLTPEEVEAFVSFCKEKGELHGEHPASSLWRDKKTAQGKRSRSWTFTTFGTVGKVCKFEEFESSPRTGCAMPATAS
jgi:hypothetical protein